MNRPGYSWLLRLNNNRVALVYVFTAKVHKETNKNTRDSYSKLELMAKVKEHLRASWSNSWRGTLLKSILIFNDVYMSKIWK